MRAVRELGSTNNSTWARVILCSGCICTPSSCGWVKDCTFGLSSILVFARAQSAALLFFAGGYFSVFQAAMPLLPSVVCCMLSFSVRVGCKYWYRHHLACMATVDAVLHFRCALLMLGWPIKGVSRQAVSLLPLCAGVCRDHMLQPWLHAVQHRCCCKAPSHARMCCSIWLPQQTSWTAAAFSL